MNKNVKPEKILVIGLGNRNITSDSLGPEVVDNICINISEDKDTGVCTLSPGVMAQTGIETAGIIKGVVSQIKPDVCIAIRNCTNGKKYWRTKRYSNRYG